MALKVLNPPGPELPPGEPTAHLSSTAYGQPHREQLLQSHRFGNVEVHPAERALLIDGKPADLGSCAFDVLQALITHRARVVTGDELLEIVWPGLVAEENNMRVKVPYTARTDSEFALG